MITLLGADAGASHTTAVAADERGTILVRAEGAGGAVRPGTAAAAAARILETCRDALTKAERPLRAEVLVVGAAGVGREEERLALAAALEAGQIAPRVVVTTDGAIALQTAFADAPGIVLLAGTGSVAYARLPDGGIARAGGLGAQMGDEGSGYDLGRQALRAIGLAADGRGRATRLTRLVTRRLRLNGTEALVRWTATAEVPAIASLASLVLEAAGAGDTVASGIADAGADELVRHVRALAQAFGRAVGAVGAVGAAIPVALGGSLLAKSETYRQRVVARIVTEVPAAQVRSQPLDAASGAIQLALRQMGH